MREYEEILDFLRNKVFAVLQEGAVDELPGDDAPLVTTGVLDSLAVVDLATYMESEFGVDFSATFFDVSQFETISKMANFVSHYLKSK